MWLLNPGIKMANISYSGDPALKNSFVAKQIFRSEAFNKLFGGIIRKMHGKDIELIKDLTDDWENNFGGKYFCTSVMGQATAYHFHVLVFDDAMNAAIADSDTKRETSNRMHDFTFPTRKINKAIAPSVYVGQRLHDNDTIGHVMKKDEPYYYLCLPAEESSRISPPALRANYVDGLLDPIRLNRTVLAKSKRDLGSYAYSGQFNQNPSPEGGGMIKTAWLIKALPQVIYEKVKWYVFIDGAYSENTKNDPSGIMLCGVWQEKLIVRFCTSKFVEIQDLIKEITGLFMVFKLPKQTTIYIEPKASGKSLKQLLTKAGYNAVEISSYLVGENKTGRINLTIPYAEAGRITYIEGAWNHEWIHQLTAFPKADHDEYVDLTGYATERLLHNVDTVTADMEVNPSEFY